MQEHDKILRQACQHLVGDARPGARWLVDNYGFLLLQARELREALSPKFWRKLSREQNGNPRIYRIAQTMVEEHRGKITLPELAQVLVDYQRTSPLSIADLWAVRPVLKLALMDRLGVGEPDDEFVPNAITSLRTLDRASVNDFVESVSAVEAVLRQDPSGLYTGMDFETRDAYRQAIEEVAERSWHDEVEVARIAIGLARNASTGDADDRKGHVGYYLFGPGKADLRIIAGHGLSVLEAVRDSIQRYPNVFYMGSMAVLTAGMLWIAARWLAPVPWWILALLVIPLSQVALSILHPLINRLLPPRRLLRLDFSGGIPDDCRTFLVVPTLLLSKAGVESLLERIEIHYLANRDRNLLFGLLTDFADATTEHTDKDELADLCAAGIRALNERYHGPFYLFHRPRKWNASEGAWLGQERKRGKLEDFNRFLLGSEDAFSLKGGDLKAIGNIRYVITLDTDTHLPRDSARQLVATMGHPLNRPLFNDHDIVCEGFGLLQPRVSVSMESARKSRLASIYSGQTGLDPYTKAVSDVYQDLFGQASYTGKGIYDLAAFERATRNRFPDNTLLSHDLIEGEHVRVGLATDLEVVDDFPKTYEAYSKRKHRWVRGDWQIASWLLPRVPNGQGRPGPNPLSLLSRWKILDNLRRSLYEIFLVAFFLVGMFATGRALRYSAALLVILAIPAVAQLFFSLLRFPPKRLVRSFLREAGWNFMQGLLEAALTLAFLLHQALLMADAVLRTQVRRYVTKRRLLEWESMAQAEAGGGTKLSLINIYLLLCPVLATVIAFFAARENTGYQLLPIAVLMLWATTPLASEFVSQRIRFRRRRTDADTRFLRELSLETWRYFVDFSEEQENWLVPDNVQLEPHAVATRSSPTNMGLQLVAPFAAAGFGYLTPLELATYVDRGLTALERMERTRGHFYNWYDTRSLQPLQPRFVSTVDSGNLAAALITVRQGCTAALEGPLLAQALNRSLQDHCELLRLKLPHGHKTSSILRVITSFCRQLEFEPANLYSWAGQLKELEHMGRSLAANALWLEEPASEVQATSGEDAHYWLKALNSRVQALRSMLEALAPWVNGRLSEETRLFASDTRLETLMRELSHVPKIQELESWYEAVAHEIRNQAAAPGIGIATRRTLEELESTLGSAREKAGELQGSLTDEATRAERLFDEMDFGFLLDRASNLMHIGFNVESGQLEDAHYDLLASEARTAVFIAVAKGDIPRESWFRLGRKLTTYRGYRTLLSWSGTMFEYLMPSLFLRDFEDSLLAESAAGAVRIQQSYARARGVPWGISEAAHSERDVQLNYQYRAFGVPVLGLGVKADDLVIAPYASVLALMVDPIRATSNLKHMTSREWRGRYGFFEAVDYTGARPEVVRAYMIHHQGMALLALANTLLDKSIQRLFHSNPLVLATELLLQERLPALIEETEEEERLDVKQTQGPSMVGAAQEG